MPRGIYPVLFVLALTAGLAFGQGETSTGSGYADPSIVRVAPGQIVTLFVTGLKTVLASQPVTATGMPLPTTTLAGISVTLNQIGGQTAAIPLLSIRQVSACRDAAVSSSNLPTECLITAVTVQIPFELIVSPPNLAESVVSENRIASQAFRISPVPDNLHVINTCDAFPATNLTSSFCALVSHANGSLVTATQPARAGEEIVIWAFGLGQSTPSARTGQASPSPASTLASFTYLRFDFRIDAAPSLPYIDPTAALPALAPDFVGYRLAKLVCTKST